MDSTRDRRATYDDLVALDEDVRAEVIAGVVRVSPSPLPKHSKVQGAIRSFVGRPFDDDDGVGGPGGWWILLEVDVRLGEHDIVRPDLGASELELAGAAFYNSEFAATLARSGFVPRTFAIPEALGGGVMNGLSRVFPL